MDWPSARFYPELMERYPDAKVLLSVRGAEEWVKSMRQTVWGVFHGESVIHHLCEARAVLDPDWRRFMTLIRVMTWNDDTGVLAGHDTYTDAGLAAAMERWNENVRRTVPAERLLVWEPTEGWEPLCEFLEVAGARRSAAAPERHRLVPGGADRRRARDRDRVVGPARAPGLGPARRAAERAEPA